MINVNDYIRVGSRNWVSNIIRTVLPELGDQEFTVRQMTNILIDLGKFSSLLDEGDVYRKVRSAMITLMKHGDVEVVRPGGKGSVGTVYKAVSHE